MTDSELHTLQEKVKRLTHDRDVALKMAAHSDQLFKDMKTEMENYRKLWEYAERRMHKTDTDLLVAMSTSRKQGRTIHDWIWTAIILAVFSGITYFLGWVLVWP